jgi:hypothetical protein
MLSRFRLEHQVGAGTGIADQVWDLMRSKHLDNLRLGLEQVGVVHSETTIRNGGAQGFQKI